MFGKFSVMAAILATVALPVTEALASRADSHHGGYRVGYRASTSHRGYRSGHYSGYGVHYNRSGYVVVPVAAWPDLGSLIYGYPYGTPCYRYNDRDWDYEWVC